MINTRDFMTALFSIGYSNWAIILSIDIVSIQCKFYTSIIIFYKSYVFMYNTWTDPLKSMRPFLNDFSIFLRALDLVRA